ncbi:hypothetical protein ES703_62833 [subsurface metagenome]
MANEGAGAAIVGIGLFILGLFGLGVAAAAASAEKDEKKQALLERIDKDVQEAKDYLKGRE